MATQKEAQESERTVRFGVRVERATLERFSMAAKANHRTSGAEIRRLMEGRIEEFEAEIAETA